MFGGKLRTWMETHIGRQRKKSKERKDRNRNRKSFESNESLAHSDTGISSGSMQVLSSSTSDYHEGYSTTATIESKPGNSRTVNLSSPESAYSTGYSTDGTSPASHPEYYINLRTGKHYFPSPAPTPTSPTAKPLQCFATSFLSTEPRIPPLPMKTIPEQHHYEKIKSPKPKSPLNTLKSFLNPGKWKIGIGKEPKLVPKLEVQEHAPSPKQRNRIRTNPWVRNRSCNNTPLQPRRVPQTLEELNQRYEGAKDYLTRLEQAVAKHLEDSEDDLTLHEVMGTCTESYIYEKETDILSDSDPTDCEDYVTDSEAIHGGDEDSHDDELDFIDEGAVVQEEPARPNTRRCSYHNFLSRSRSREAKKRRRSKKREEPMNKVLDRVKKVNSKSAESSPVWNRRRRLKETHIGSLDVKGEFNEKFLEDAEADRKYNQLIEEAEHMLESLKNTPVVDKRRCPNPQVTMLVQQDRLFRKEIPKSSPKRLTLSLEVGNNTKKTSLRANSSAHSPIDPLGPTNRNLSIFTPREKKLPEPESLLKIPTMFQSVDMGTLSNSYCPQSEPVKRKIYTGSSSYDKLVKTMEPGKPQLGGACFFNPMYSPINERRRKKVDLV